jgi:hypothetical protein
MQQTSQKARRSRRRWLRRRQLLLHSLHLRMRLLQRDVLD